MAQGGVFNEYHQDIPGGEIDPGYRWFEVSQGTSKVGELVVMKENHYWYLYRVPADGCVACLPPGYSGQTNPVSYVFTLLASSPPPNFDPGNPQAYRAKLGYGNKNSNGNLIRVDYQHMLKQEFLYT